MGQVYSATITTGSDALGSTGPEVSYTTYNNDNHGLYQHMPEDVVYKDGVGMTPEQAKELGITGSTEQKDTGKEPESTQEPEVAEGQTIALSESGSEALSNLHMSLGGEGYTEIAQALGESMSVDGEITAHTQEALEAALGPDAIEQVNGIIGEVQSTLGKRCMSFHKMSTSQTNEFAEYVMESALLPNVIMEASRGKTALLDELALDYMSGNKYL